MSKIGARRASMCMFAASSFVAGCGLSKVSSWENDQSPPDAAAGFEVAAIDRWKELLVDSPELVGGPRADNTVQGAAWSFRSQLEWFAGSADRAPDLARAWLEQWVTVTEVGDAHAPVTPRPLVSGVLVDPWQRLSNDPRHLDLSKTPFRLLAIMNRIDLADGGCDPGGGELRFVYTALDPANGSPLAMTVNVEIPYPDARVAHDWANAWHVAAREDGESYAAALEDLTRTIQDHVDPQKVRVRTNERALAPDTGWELREFRPLAKDSEVALTQVPIDTTPRTDLPERLSAALSAGAANIVAGSFVLPAELRAGAATLPAPDFVWSVPGVSMDIVRAFSRGTCNGCHGGETEALPFQHVGAGDTPGSSARVSRFLNTASGTDELGRREQKMAFILAFNCGTPVSTYY